MMRDEHKSRTPDRNGVPLTVVMGYEYENEVEQVKETATKGSRSFFLELALFFVVLLAFRLVLALTELPAHLSHYIVSTCVEQVSCSSSSKIKSHSVVLFYVPQEYGINVSHYCIV